MITITTKNLKNIYFRFSIFRKMSTIQQDSPNCIFCKIVNKSQDTEILYENERIICFRDIKPASRFHILTVPKVHIEDVKSLDLSHKELLTHMLSAAKELLVKNGISIENARYGYHWPPFRSIKHLHLHTIAPESEMGFFGRIVFKKDSYWFVSPEYVESLLK